MDARRVYGCRGRVACIGPFPSRHGAPRFPSLPHPGGNPGANLKSISRRCYLREVAFAWELTKEAFAWELPLGCLQGGLFPLRGVGRGQRQRRLRVQEYLTYKKTHPPRTLP